MIWHHIPGARPTSNISIEFESRPKFEVLWVKMYSADHNEILFMSRQFHCCDVCKISLRSVWHILNYSTLNVDRISNSIEILLVGRGPGSPLVLVVCLALCQQCWLIMDWTHRDNLDRNLIKNTTDFVQENAVENVFCKTAAILFRPLFVNMNYHEKVHLHISMA